MLIVTRGVRSVFVRDIQSIRQIDNERNYVMFVEIHLFSIIENDYG